MTDPIGDMLSRIRNAAKAGHASLSMPKSNLKVEIAKILKSEGFIASWSTEDKPGKRQKMNANGELVRTSIPHLSIDLKYDAKHQSVLRGIQRISKPSRRYYVDVDTIPRVRNGLGIAILTTSRGVMTDYQARTFSVDGVHTPVGGEILCYVW
jgi:small subunit ribosomal protein S8